MALYIYKLVFNFNFIYLKKDKNVSDFLAYLSLSCHLGCVKTLREAFLAVF